MKHGILFRRITSFLMLYCTAALMMSNAQNLPFQIENRSIFPNDQVYIALLGRVGDQSVWLDVTNGEIHPINTSYNTIQGPDFGSPGAGGNHMYADCFRKLSDIPNSTIDLPKIASVRIFMSFNEQLYLYFFEDGGYSGPDLANETDPNQDIRFEIIELTYNDIGIWANTTRVDYYQYPMGLEVWGNNGFYKKVGEVLTHEEIINAWKSRVPQKFQVCLDDEKEIIHQPSKLPEFKEGGIYYDYFDSYVDEIWNRYMNEDLIIGIGDAGSWVGRVDADGETFRFESASDGRKAIVEARPNTQEIFEGKGVLAHDVPETPTADDLDVQKHFCAAFTRGVIDPNANSGTGNDWSNEADFFQQNTFNEYVKFWHSKDISYEGETYAFCYDDVFDYSSTIHTTVPTLAKITIGGFAGQPSLVIDRIEITPESITLNSGDTQQFSAKAYDAEGTEVQTSFNWSDNAPNGLFTAYSGGNYTVNVSANGILGSSEITVIGSADDNLALQKNVVVSSTEGQNLGSNAVDGDENTRWSSEFSDPQWLYVDLGQSCNIDRIVIVWETARARDYEIQVSDDASSWQTIRTVTENLSERNEESNLNTTGRYLRIYGTARATGYGYSIKELEIYSKDPNQEEEDPGEEDHSLQYFMHIEAEDYVDMSGIGIENCTEGGQNLAYIDANDWMEYKVSVPYDGQYNFDARISCAVTEGATLEILEDNIVVGSMSVTQTGGWQNWNTFTTTVNLTEGTHTLRIKVLSGGWNVNWYELSNNATGPLYIPLHIEYCQYLRLGFSPTDEKNMSELITQNISRDTCIFYNEGSSITINLVEKRRTEDIRFYTFNNGNRKDTIKSELNGSLSVTAYKGMEIYADFIELGPTMYDPVADAGNNMDYDLENGDCFTLNGTPSFDPDGGLIQTYSWIQISGPNTVSMSNTEGVTNRICDLMKGVYEFELTVTDDEGATGSDIIILNVIQEEADFTLITPLNNAMLSESRRPEFTWDNVAGATRYDIYINVSKDNYDWYASGNLLDRYTKVGETTTNSFTIPYDLTDRWTYKWYVQAITGDEVLESNKQQFGVYIPSFEQEDDGVNTSNGYRDMNKNGTMEPFENWRLTPEERLEDLMSRLPLEEKFKQSFYGGGNDPKDGFNFSYGVEHIMKAEQKSAAATTWGIPMAHAGDKIHGWKTIYPTQLGLAATRNPNIAYQCGNMQRIEHKSFGFAGTLTPLAEVDTKVLYPRFQEGNGENAEEASAIIRALVCGMQGGPEINPHSMLVTVKHWPSQGAGGEGPTQYDGRTIGYHMKPWYAMVEANAASVMPGYSTSPFLDPSLAGSNSSKPIIDYLRDVIGFKGFIVTDWLAATTAQSIESMSAGIDVLGGAPSSLSNVEELVAAIGLPRLEQACRRVLDMKIRLGLFENPYGDPTATWTNEEHHDIALNAARKSITLLKNDGILPLTLHADEKIGVAGPRATWDGQNSDPNVIWQSIYYENPQAMNYVEAFNQRASNNGITVISGQGITPDVAVAVIGEQAYTHGTEWDDKNPNIPEEQMDIIRDFANRNIPVVTVVISPRPYVLTEVSELSSAVMLVYRGGNGIAQATAELCFGDYNPSGKLPFQLPRSQDQIGTDDLNNQVEHWELPYDIGATEEERAEIIDLMANDLPIEPIYGDPLFQYGFGLDSFTKLSTSTRDDNYTSDEIFVYPNPVLDYIYIKLNTEDETRVEIYALSGQLIKSTTIENSKNVSINVSDLNTGYYLLKIKNGESSAITKFIKE